MRVNRSLKQLLVPVGRCMVFGANMWMVVCLGFGVVWSQTSRNPSSVPPPSSMDMVGEGIVRVSVPTGTATFNFTLLRNGASQAQHIFLKQPDGKFWDGNVKHLAPGGARALEFIETQHSRGLAQLADSSKRHATVRDGGLQAAGRLLTVEDSDGNTTRYIVDDPTQRITRMEFSRQVPPAAQARKGRVQLESYVFSDYRNIAGAPSNGTPYHVEHSSDGIGQEDLQFSDVRFFKAARLGTVFP